MQISKRLLTIASMIEDNCTLFDIGCDHGLLDIYLTQNLKNIFCIASDVNQNALNVAIKNIDKYNLNNKIKTVISNGLENLDINNNSVIVISGMGTSTIKEILNNDKSALAKKIIIQSNNNLYELRKYMIEKGFKITNEKIVNDNNKYYVVISFEKGKARYNYFQLYFGPKIIKDKIQNKDYLIYIKNKEQLKLCNIPKKYIFLRLKSFFLIKKIMGYIR